MSQYGSDSSWISRTTAAADTATSAFVPPRGCTGMTIFAPNLATDTTFALQIAQPNTLDGGTETWATLNVYDLQDLSGAVTAVPDTVASYIPFPPTGHPLRISFTTAQAATFYIVFHR
jgi:hypothetical protein